MAAWLRTGPSLQSPPLVQRQATARLHVYNSLTRRLDEFPTPAAGAPLTWYTCGPTVYDVAHVGHARTYVALDILRRVVARRLPVGASLTFALGVTDVDDKIIARAAARGVPAADVAADAEAGFHADMDALGVAPPTLLLRVTEHMDAIVDLVARIASAGFAYEAPGGVYFDTGAWGARYGKLAPPPAGRGGDDSNGGDGNDGARLRADEGKRRAADFALWKRRAAGDGGAGAAPTWASPWGAGRPGWHIECSAMCAATFGAALDVHAGGADLAFPHHCNELAQCEAALVAAHAAAASAPPSMASSPWCSTWLHTGHVSIAGRKMSKSLKNFVTVREALAACGGGGGDAAADAFRMFVAAQRYRAGGAYSVEALREGAARAARAAGALGDVAAVAATALPPSARRGERWGAGDAQLAAALAAARADVAAALADDFDTPTALARLGDFAAAAQAAAVGGAVPPPRGLLVAAAAFLADEYAALGFRFPTVLTPAGVAAPATTGEVGGDALDGAALQAADGALAALLALRGDVRAVATALGGAAARSRADSGAGGAPPDGGAAPAAAALADAARAAAAALHAASDHVRDVALPRLGLQLKDTPAGAVVTPR